MPDLMVNRGSSSTTTGSVTQGRWLDQQQYLIETYRQIRDNLGQMEAEIEAARLRVTDWSRHRREPSRSRSLSHASISTNTSSHWSCSTFESSCTDASCLHVHTDSALTGSSCPSSSSCSSTCGITLPAAVAASLNAATLISAFLSASVNSTSTAVNATNTPNTATSMQSIEDRSLCDQRQKPLEPTQSEEPSVLFSLDSTGESSELNQRTVTDSV
ncbi:hypothetical protein FBUS_00707 [Fasciolopsis buskii]|uniref:Uncharacterized protein n=1 Tax=Fasciolopsis buskii TaxID=27845 RepID=A0A8E0RN31_9TREM|nr:hypothetical protein FBUS_00707 [Fasciolopsis buski]